MNYVDCVVMCIHVWLNTNLFYKRIYALSLTTNESRFLINKEHCPTSIRLLQFTGLTFALVIFGP